MENKSDRRVVLLSAREHRLSHKKKAHCTTHANPRYVF